MATVETQRHDLVPADRSGQEQLVSDPAVIEHAAFSAAEFPRTPVLVVEGVLVYRHAIPRLSDLDWDVVSLSVTDAELTALAVLVMTRSPAADQRLDKKKQLAVVRVQPC